MHCGPWGSFAGAPPLRAAPPQGPELVAQILLDQVQDDLRGRPRHRFRTPSRVLAEVHQVRLQPVVGPLRRALPQTPRLGRQHLPGHVAAQSRRGPRTRQVPAVRELPSDDLEELPGVPDVEVPGQLLQQPDGLLLRHF